MAQLLLSVMGAFAEFERSLIRERQREGVALAKAWGAYRGRKRSLTDERVAELRERAGAGGEGRPGAGVRHQPGDGVPVPAGRDRPHHRLIRMPRAVMPRGSRGLLGCAGPGNVSSRSGTPGGGLLGGPGVADAGGGGGGLLALVDLGGGVERVGGAEPVLRFHGHRSGVDGGDHPALGAEDLVPGLVCTVNSPCSTRPRKPPLWWGCFAVFAAGVGVEDDAIPGGVGVVLVCAVATPAPVPASTRAKLPVVRIVLVFRDETTWSDAVRACLNGGRRRAK